MTKFDHWPMWVQITVALPHAILMGLLLWAWWPKTQREWLRWWGCFGYLVIFYLIFVR